MAVTLAPSVNHSRMVASRPADRAAMWFFSSIPSARHLSSTSLLVTPSSRASSNTRVAKETSRHSVTARNSLLCRLLSAMFYLLGGARAPSGAGAGLILVDRLRLRRLGLGHGAAPGRLC